MLFKIISVMYLFSDLSMSESYKSVLRKKDAILELPSVLADAIDQ